MAPSVDVLNKVVHLRAAGAEYTGKLVKGPNGFCNAEFETSSLNFQTQVPNLMMGVVPVPKKRKRTRASTKRRPAAAEKLLQKPAAADAAKPAGYPVGHVVFSDDESDSTEGAEEERPKVRDVPESEPEDDPPAAAPAGPSSSPAAAPAGRPRIQSSSAGEPRGYTKMFYKKSTSIAIRRKWKEEGYSKPRQAFCFGVGSGKNEVELNSIATQTIRKLEVEGATEAEALEWAKEQLR